MECAPSHSAMALLHEDGTGPDVYVAIVTDPANAQVLLMPTTLPPPPIGRSEKRHCRFHAAEGVHEHRLSDSGQQAATSLAGAIDRFELQSPGSVAPEVNPADVPMLGDQVYYAQLGDTTVLDYHPRDVRGGELEERLSMAVRLAAKRLLEEAGMDGAAEEALYVAMWRRIADASLSSHSGPSRLRRRGPMAFLWCCTPKAWRLLSAWMARSSCR